MSTSIASTPIAPSEKPAKAVNVKAATAKKAVRTPAKKAPPANASRKASTKPSTAKKATDGLKPVTKSTVAPKTKTPTKVKPMTEVKVKKPKLVRDSFTFPKDEYQAIAALKTKALSLQHGVKKSEILRAGLMLISSLNDKAFLAALSKVPALKTGRPAKD